MLKGHRLIVSEKLRNRVLQTIHEVHFRFEKMQLRAREAVFWPGIGSLRSYYGDAEDNFDQKMNLYFTYESRDTLNSFCLFITVKAITKLNLGHHSKFEIEFQKISRRSSCSP